MDWSTIGLIILALLGVAKAFFEWRKAKAERLMLVCTIQGVEEAKKKLPYEAKQLISKEIMKVTRVAGVEGKINKIIKEIT